MSTAKLTAANFIIMVSGAVIFIASFLTFKEIPRGTNFDLGNGLVVPTPIGISMSTWHRGTFIIATLPALLGLAMAGQIALATFVRSVGMPSRFLGMTWSQVHLALALQALVMMLAFLIQDHDPFSYGTGFWLMFIAAIGLFIGALMKTREPAGSTY
jgi:hypothetical protein